jgi:hypothetical protein
MRENGMTLKRRQTVAVYVSPLEGARACLFIGEVKGLITIP